MFLNILILQGIEKKSPLHYAVQKNAIECVLLLLQCGAEAETPQLSYNNEF